MIPKVDRSRLFYGAVVVQNSNDTWIFNGLYNTITICRDGKIVNQKIYKEHTV
jgi:hypothetical protein